MATISKLQQTSETANAADKENFYTLIFGETIQGKKFRPSDWSDRLHGVLRALEDEEEDVSEYVHLVNYEGQKCVMIDSRLENVHLSAYRFFIRFAQDNQLLQKNISQQEWVSKHS